MRSSEAVAARTDDWPRIEWLRCLPCSSLEERFPQLTAILVLVTGS